MILDKTYKIEGTTLRVQLGKYYNTDALSVSLVTPTGKQHATLSVMSKEFSNSSNFVLNRLYEGDIYAEILNDITDGFDIVEYSLTRAFRYCVKSEYLAALEGTIS